MDPAFFIALLNPGISLVLAAAFAVLWAYQRKRYLAGLAVAYCCSAIGFLCQQFVLPIGLPLTKTVSVVAFTIATVLLGAAVIERCRRPVPYPAMLSMAAAGLVAFLWFMFVEPSLTWRILVINFAFGGISLLVVAELRRTPDKEPVEKVLFVLALLAGINFVLRTLLLVHMHGPYETYDGFYTSTYWNTVVLSHALLSLLIALSLITSAALDVIRTLDSQSRTDQLSGLFNRRGFEEAANAAIDRARRHGQPVTLLLADLDHFKSVNDTYGHAVGDKVIVAFAALLRQSAGRYGVAGRLGGEEFAVLLPSADLAAARLLAAGVRTAFVAGPIRDVPDRVRVTASFGVGALSAGETLSALLSRADDALYRAKQSGRDSVRLSYERRAESPAQARPLLRS